jgi:membrane protease YdiL (CAAX protease family)
MTTTLQDDGKTEPLSMRPATGIFRPLGFWASLLWFVIALVVSFVAGVLLVVLVLFVTNADVGGLKDEIRFEISLIVNPISVRVFTGVLVWAVRRIKWLARDYFAVVSPTRRALVLAFIGACGFVLIEQLLSLYIGADWSGSGASLTRFRAARAGGAALLALYCLYMVVVAPITEEIAFRGFLYRGWSLPPLGPPSAIVLTAAAFGAVHATYSWLGMLFVGASALFFGWLRWRSDSIIPSMLSHATINVAALISFALEA